MRRIVSLIALFLVFVGLIATVGGADTSDEQLAPYLFKSQKLGDGWELVTTGTPAEPLVGTTGKFEHTSNSTFYQILLTFQNDQAAHQHFVNIRKAAGEEAYTAKELADEAYIKPALQGKPRELVFRIDNIITVYLWTRAEGAQDLDLFNLARLQLNKMGQEIKSS